MKLDDLFEAKLNLDRIVKALEAVSAEDVTKLGDRVTFKKDDDTFILIPIGSNVRLKKIIDGQEVLISSNRTVGDMLMSIFK